MRGKRSIHGALRGSDKHREASSLKDQGSFFQLLKLERIKRRIYSSHDEAQLTSFGRPTKRQPVTQGWLQRQQELTSSWPGGPRRGPDDDHRICQKRRGEACASATAGWLPGFAGRTVAGQEARLSSGRCSAGGSPSARVDEQVKRSADCRRQAVGRVASQSTSVRARLRCRLNQQLGSCSNAGRTG